MTVEPAPLQSSLQLPHASVYPSSHVSVSGQVALFGGSRIGVFRTFVRTQYPNVNFIETENGWYSIDGEDKNQCVMELGQTAEPDDNYRNCVGRKMGREVFN